MRNNVKSAVRMSKHRSPSRFYATALGPQWSQLAQANRMRAQSENALLLI
jgi:hypothetical protein